MFAPIKSTQLKDVDKTCADLTKVKVHFIQYKFSGTYQLTRANYVLAKRKAKLAQTIHLNNT